MTTTSSTAATSNATEERSRISAAFDSCRAEQRAALIPFATVGYPDLDTSYAIIEALIRGGADLIEIGIPFSDPLADGATVQHSSQVALEQGTTLADGFALARRLQDAGHSVPTVFMGYLNPFMQYGLDQLAIDAAASGVDGFIIPDLPVEESEEVQAALRSTGRDLIFMVAPTSTDHRIEDVATSASGFIYCVSLTGTTGARQTISAELPTYIERIRARTDLPLAVGFGISNPEHVQTVAATADGVIVASAIINYFDSLPIDERIAGVEAFTRSLAEATHRTS